MLQETAINIGVSCKLVSSPDKIMILNVNEKQARGGMAQGNSLTFQFPMICSDVPLPNEP